MPSSIVCIDDSADMRIILEKFLKDAGYDVKTASGGREGIDLVKRDHPDLVLLDIMMPDMDGFETCSRLQKDPATASIPVMFISAVKSEEDRLRAFAVGGVDFLSKPPSKQAVLDKVRKIIEKSGKWSDLNLALTTQIFRPVTSFREFKGYLASKLESTAAQADEIAAMGPHDLYPGMAAAGVPEDRIALLIARFTGYTHLKTLERAEIRLGILPTSFCKENLVVPVKTAGEGEGLVITNPFNRELMDLLSTLPKESRGTRMFVTAPQNVRLLFAVETGEHDVLEGGKAEGRAKSIEEILGGEEEMPAQAGEAEDEEESERVSENDSAVVRLVNHVINEAWKLKASDIHFEPTAEGGVDVRYRVDGALYKALDIPRRYRAALPSRLKIMAGLDIAEKRLPQSGKISFKRWGKIDIELRIETVPTADGSEDAVLRILSASEPLPVDRLGMSQRNLAAFKRIIEEPYGLFLCVGPTGSGKTTTLHAALKHLNTEDVKILTAEDPVEITQPGLRQIQVNLKAGRTFASALRSFLRADPDIIMIGEMRDRETASIAIEASLTGHLVLSTLHTNSAPETIVRLVNMEVDPYSFADSLLGILAQRLLRTLCKECKRESVLGEADLWAMKEEYGSPDRFESLGARAGMKVFRREAKGCDACRGTGFRGRMAVHEVLVADDGIRSLITRSGTALDLRDRAVAGGMRTLKQDGIEKVLAGHTTFEEVRAVCSR